MRSSRWLVLGLGISGFVGVAGCSSDEPFTDGGGSGGAGASASSGSGGSDAGGGGEGTGSSSSASSSSTGAGGCPGLGDPCTQCEAAKCQPEYCACYQNSDCVDLASCGLRCDPQDFECLQACWTASPGGISDGALIVDCAAKSCAEECPGTVALTPCQQCLYQECPEPMNTCIANAQCSLLLFCIASCTTDSCVDDCSAQYPNGLGDAGPVAECSQMHCSATCG